MTRRTLATLTVTHRGVPIGTTPLVEEDLEHPRQLASETPVEASPRSNLTE